MLCADGLDLLERNGSIAECVHVEIHTTVVVENEVTDGIGALDVEWEVVPGVDEPRVLFGDEVAGFVVGPVLSRISFHVPAGLNSILINIPCT